MARRRDAARQGAPVTTLLVIYWLIVACVWMSLLGLGALALMGVIKVFDLVREWLCRRRERRQLDEATEYLMRIGFLAAEADGLVNRNDL